MTIDGNKVGFGAEYAKRETPWQIKRLYQLLMFLSAMWMMAIEPRVTISDHAAHLVDVSLAIGNYGIYFFCQNFGFKMPEGAVHPEDQATQS